MLFFAYFISIEILHWFQCVDDDYAFNILTLFLRIPSQLKYYIVSCALMTTIYALGCMNRIFGVFTIPSEILYFGSNALINHSKICLCISINSLQFDIWSV